MSRCGGVCMCAHTHGCMYHRPEAEESTGNNSPSCLPSLSPSFSRLSQTLIFTSLPLCGFFFYFPTGQNPLSSPATSLALALVCLSTDSWVPPPPSPAINGMSPLLQAGWQSRNGCHCPGPHNAGHSYSHRHRASWDLCIVSVIRAKLNCCLKCLQKDYTMISHWDEKISCTQKGR